MRRPWLLCGLRMLSRAESDAVVKSKPMRAAELPATLQSSRVTADHIACPPLQQPLPQHGVPTNSGSVACGFTSTSPLATRAGPRTISIAEHRLLEAPIDHRRRGTTPEPTLAQPRLECRNRLQDIVRRMRVLCVGIGPKGTSSNFSPVPIRVMDGSEPGVDTPAAVLSGAPIELQARTVRYAHDAQSVPRGYG